MGFPALCSIAAGSRSEEARALASRSLEVRVRCDDDSWCLLLEKWCCGLWLRLRLTGWIL